MLDWIFKYKVRVPGAATDKTTAKTGSAADKPAAQATEGAGAPAKSKTSAKAKPALDTPAVDWAAKLQTALGDDTALLALAREAASPLQNKLDTVAALTTEEALKTAEHHFRNQNRRVHSLAKQRLQALRVTREARTEAARLIDAAQLLASEAQIPVNSAVQLDRAWSALDSTLLQPEQREHYAALTLQLSALTRARADLAAHTKRWQTDAQQALALLQAASHQAAAGEEPRTALTDAQGAVQALAHAAPAGSDTAPLLGAVAAADDLAVRLALLEQVLAGPADTHRPPAVVASDPAPVPEAAPESAPEAAPESVLEATPEVQSEGVPEATPEATPEAVPEPAPAVAAAPPATATETPAAPAAQAAPDTPRPARPAQQFQALPPLADKRLAALLQARFEAWQRSQDNARQQVKAQRREQAKEQKQAVRSERAGALEAVLQQAEAQLADGLVAETHKQLVEIDELLHGGAPAEALRARIDRLQAGYAELRGWQTWAGSRARDELAQEAETLAARSAPGPGQLPKVPFKEHADLIDSLRARWKELDRLGGASSRALWQRFEGALKAAYEPLAAIKATQSAAREQNLAARRALLDTLEAVPLPGQNVAADSAPDEGSAELTAPADLRQALSALDQFRVEWRKLGPVEHTVPRKAQERLVQRLDAAVQRLHAPVDGARREAEQERQALIERAQALAAFAQAQAQAQQNAPAPTGTREGGRDGGRDGGRGMGRDGGRDAPRGGPRDNTRDLVGEVRQLQSQWQQSAQGLPLPRQVENALWTQFRTALDAVFSARDAAFSARDAEFKAHADARSALIERLQALLPDAPAAEAQRTLADVENQWQRCGPAPRAQAAELESNFRRAREAVVQALAGSRQRAWHAQCDALQQKLALCEQREAGTAGGTDSLEPTWAELPALPTAWETALRQRAGLHAVAAGLSAPRPPLDADSLLLQLETAWNLVSPADQAAARRELQVQAMKAALETRRPPQRSAATAPAAQTPENWLADTLRQPLASAAQRARLEAVLQALRQRGGAA